jgi:preprotein translocase subunit SecD
VKSLLRNTALLELRLVEAGPASSREALAGENGELPPRTEILEGEARTGQGQAFYLVADAPVVTGRDLKTARLGQDQMGLPSVNFTLDAEGGRKFADFTGNNVGRYLAIVLDGKVRTAPVIEERIPGNGQIRGDYSIEEAEDLALVLRSGALPASIDYLEERSVGPALGRESVEQGIAAALVGMAIVVAFMLVYYKGAGINAVIALVFNLIIVVGVMNALGAALTLPGIAGLILLIGMAVDANVLIFERIREELDLGKTARSAVDTGFAKAFSTIVDANITTLVAAVFLFQFGTGPVKGFAVTLTIGILASMFTAIFVSRVLFDLWLARFPRTLSI